MIRERTPAPRRRRIDGFIDLLKTISRVPTSPELKVTLGCVRKDLGKVAISSYSP